ncbi:hypothetical protein L0P42_16130, partial [Fusicatenibacter saccharivorans]
YYRVAASPRRQKFTSPTIPYLLSIHVYILHWLFILHFSSFFFPVASSFHAASLELAIIIP